MNICIQYTGMVVYYISIGMFICPLSRSFYLILREFINSFMATSSRRLKFYHINLIYVYRKAFEVNQTL